MSQYIKTRNFLIFLFLALWLTACTVGPDYVPPIVEVPEKYREAPKGFKQAEPNDACDRKAWWEVFGDPKLNALEEQLNNANQTIANAYANYLQARALVDEARAAFFPTAIGTTSFTRQGRGKSASGNSGLSGGTSTSTTTTNSSQTGTSIGGIGNAGGRVTDIYTLGLEASWEPDIWGLVRRTVEASSAGAQASAALYTSTLLSQQALLAQTYFQLRSVDTDQKILDSTVLSYKKSLELTQNRYRAGVAARADVILAETQLQGAEAQAINNQINRAKYEHAIAVLIGQLPETFALAASPLDLTPPIIPLEVPSILLERRPDIAEAERTVAQANAEIGVAMSAYFPTLALTANGTLSSTHFSDLFSLSALSWTLGSQLTETLYDGGLRAATVNAAFAGYEATVAAYRQTVLTAFQDVEDNLSTLHILAQELIVQKEAKASAELALKLVINQYKAGTAQYTDVIVSQVTAYNAERTEADIMGQQMVTAVGLVKALGGGWDAIELIGAAG